jgi:carbon monoxide dehydrogenase subunit G
MPIKIEKTFQVKEPVDTVWKFLSDPKKVAACVPGAQITEDVDSHTYKGSIKVQVGPSVTDYKGEVRIERLDDQAHEIELVGKGQDVRGKGSASMKMTGRIRPLPDGTSEVIGVSEVNVVGILAQLGARVINEVSNKIFEEFTASFQKQLQQQRPAGRVQPGPGATSPLAAATPQPQRETTVEPKPIKAIPLLLSALWAGLVRFFKRPLGNR